MRSIPIIKTYEDFNKQCTIRRLRPFTREKSIWYVEIVIKVKSLDYFWDTEILFRDAYTGLHLDKEQVKDIAVNRFIEHYNNLPENYPY